jgi:6-phosphogluconolactonase
MGKGHVYVGGGDGKIRRYALDPETSALTLQTSTEAGDYPSFLAVAPDKKHLYAVNEPGEALASFAIDSATGDLAFLNRVPCPGGPCHVAVDSSGGFVLAASYGGGLVHVFPVEPDGSLRRPSQTLEPGPCAHCIVTDPSNQFAFSACLGSDRIVQFTRDAATGALSPNAKPSIATNRGAGPRHITFHPGGKYVYIVNEVDSTMGAYVFGAASGQLSPMQTLSTLPEGFAGKSYAAHVQVSPSGRFLFGSNRGHDSIVIYAIDEPTGKLTLVGYESTGGRTPRNFAIDPTGTFLFVANQESNDIVSFRIDAQTGKLQRLHTTKVGAPPFWIGIVQIP